MRPKAKRDICGCAQLFGVTPKPERMKITYVRKLSNHSFQCGVIDELTRRTFCGYGTTCVQAMRDAERQFKKAFSPNTRAHRRAKMQPRTVKRTVCLTVPVRCSLQEFGDALVRSYDALSPHTFATSILVQFDGPGACLERCRRCARSKSPRNGSTAVQNVAGSGVTTGPSLMI